MTAPRFLKKEEYALSIPLFISCFGNDKEFMDEYYGGTVNNGRIAVIELDGRIISMVQLQPFTAVYRDRQVTVPYIMGVCTDPSHRHQGYMDALMRFCMDALALEAYPWCFLIAVDKEIYRHLGFVFDWKLDEQEQELLFADEGLDSASACLISDTSWSAPLRIIQPPA
ncbi:MAG: GNAT family N-acetyltransferase [Eubacteriales bacterium]|nr:GNAT family N-acetyltransferase [Eubacteriales bacterium]